MTILYPKSLANLVVEVATLGTVTRSYWQALNGSCISNFAAKCMMPDGTKPLLERMLQLIVSISTWISFSEIVWKYKIYRSRKCIWKYCLQDVGHFVLVWMCQIECIYGPTASETMIKHTYWCMCTKSVSNTLYMKKKSAIDKWYLLGNWVGETGFHLSDECQRLFCIKFDVNCLTFWNR